LHPLAGTRVFATVAEMVKILEEEFGVWGEEEAHVTVHGSIKKSRVEGKKLFGRIHIKVLMVVFDWMSHIYNGAKKVSDAVAAGDVNRVLRMNSMRSFELTINRLSPDKPVKDQLIVSGRRGRGVRRR
jgi:hypothetical protein